LQSVAGPLANSTISYSYDQLGRVVNRSINGAANSMSIVYDALGRVTLKQTRWELHNGLRQHKPDGFS